MHQKKNAARKVTIITIEEYLAEFARSKFPVDVSTGGLRIPATSDLYHCIWSLMSRPRGDRKPSSDGNLIISLPCRRSRQDGQTWKDPYYYNYLSMRAVREIEQCIRRMFNFELHRVLLENEEFGHPKRNKEVVLDFIRYYNLTAISDDALLKNYYRYRMRLCPKRIRKYEKKKVI